MARVSRQIADDVAEMKRSAMGRDNRMGQVRKVRDGELRDLWPDQFSEKYPQSIVANFVDVVARDLAEVCAPLPTLSCSSGAMKSESDKRRAERKNRIGEHYWRESRLDTQMFYGADQYLTYGFIPLRLEPDMDNRRPMIHLDDPVGVYYRLDRRFKVKVYARCWKQSTAELAAQWPECASQILNDSNGRARGDRETEVVHHLDDKNITLYLPDRDGLILASYPHRMSRCPVEIATRPGLHTDPRGQFDDVLWVQLARAVMAQLTLEAGHKAVQAPIVVPNDIVEMGIGPDSVIQTDKGASSVGRVHLQVPSEAFALEAQLDQEMKIGSRYPDARLGQAQASVITGKGVQALMGGFDTQIKSAQTFLGRMLQDGTELAFEMDEVWFPNKTETIRGTISGRSYQMTYKPSVDIAGNYTCDITYGFASGMSPQNALVTMLQARGDGLIDRDSVRRQLPWGLDVEQVQRDLDVQETEDALKQGLFAALGSAGQMMAQGMTDQAMMFFTAADALIKGRQNGQPVNEVLMGAFQDYIEKQKQAAEAAQQAQADAGGGAGGPGGEGVPGVGPDGLPPNTAPGQAGLAPGGLPDIQSLVSGFRNGSAEMSSSVRKRIPTG
jgi:hypothetical protein